MCICIRSRLQSQTAACQTPGFRTTTSVLLPTRGLVQGSSCTTASVLLQPRKGPPANELQGSSCARFGAKGPPVHRRGFMSRALAALAALSMATALRVQSDSGAAACQLAQPRQAAYERDRLLRQLTPYGELEVQWEAPATEGDPVTVYIAHPLVWLYTAANTCLLFYNFLKDALGGAAGRVVLYADEATPGNVLRMEPNRKYLAVYWSVMEFPDWFLQTRTAWFPICFVPVPQLKRLLGGTSALIAYIMEMMWRPAPTDTEVDLERTGMILRHALGGEQHVKLSFGCFLGDERLHKVVACCTGSSGVKVCCCCKNIFYRVRPEDCNDGWCHHATRCSDPELFDCWSYEELQAAIQPIQHEWATGRTAAALSLETELGFRYNHGLGCLWGPIAPVARIPESIYWDACHNAAASGGVAQYEINQLLHALESQGLSTAFQQAFLARVVLPTSLGKKIRLSLSARVRAGEDTHLESLRSGGIWLDLRAAAALRERGAAPGRAPASCRVLCALGSRPRDLESGRRRVCLGR